MELISMPISITCEVLPDQEQPGANPNQPEQPQPPLLTELPFQMDAEVVPEEEELYQRFYQRLAADLAKELACSCEGCHED